MKNFLTSRMNSALLGATFLYLVMQASASATPIDSTGWNVNCPTPVACTNGSNNGFSIYAGLSLGSAAESSTSIVFSESAMAQAKPDNFGLRTTNMHININNVAGAPDITGLHIELIDTSAHLTGDQNTPSHPGYAHFHDTNLQINGVAPGASITTRPIGSTAFYTAIDISGLMLHGGQTLDLFDPASTAFGIHQWEHQGQDRSFTLAITAFGAAPPATVPLPGTFSLLLAGLIAFGAQLVLRKNVLGRAAKPA